MKTFHLTVATFDKVLIQEDVVAAYFHTPQGEIGVLTNHTTYLTDILPGQLRYIKASKETGTLDITRPGLFFIKNNQARLWIC